MKVYQKQSLGQVFIKDKNIIDKIIATAKLTPEDHVIEIGCGEGWLSKRLSEVAKKVTIIELDERFMGETKDRLGNADNVNFILSDVLKVNLQALLGKERVKVVANIPYYISAKITQWLVDYIDNLDMALIMVQKEFAEKLVAKSGTKAYTSLAVYTQAHFDVSFAFHISRNSFRPIPKVDSGMVMMRPNVFLPESVNREQFFNLVRSSFWGRRKTLLKCLKESPHITIERDVRDLNFFKTNPQMRGETLELVDFLRLYQELFESM